ncbi:MAG TPA: type II toxin-antitoxin system VapC family toxin [Candidatus Limnocylindria bacterium]|nr:type II toxin-antitoxin system VapC family toxin [Candidatus Limnocylindria bacterium]
MRYLLDTTLIIDHAHGYEPAMRLLQGLYEEGAELFTCDVVVCEALSGGTDEHREVIGRLLAPLDYVATDPDSARAAGEARRRRHAEGGRLGLGDALIAAVAKGLEATIVTRNRPDFARQGATVLAY